MPTESTYIKPLEPNVLLVGAPLIDLTVASSEQFLHTLPGKKGGMETISEKQFENLLFQLGSPESKNLGGSAANVAQVLAHLGTNCSFAGKLGCDAAGDFYLQILKKLKITSYCTYGQKPTGHAFCIVTPDALRTCRTFLGASSEFEVSDLLLNYYQDKTLLHLEGYSLLKDGLAEKAIGMAKQNGLLVSFDLGSFEMVENNRTLIEELLPSIDILFGNEEEAKSLTGAKAVKSCELLKEKVKIAIVFQGDKGCIVGETGEKLLRIPANPVQAVDTTGAGDFFTGAFLHLFLKGKPLKECAMIGAYCASQVVQIFGTQLPASVWQKINQPTLHHHH